MNCDFQINDNSLWQCIYCHYIYPIQSAKPPRRNCPKSPNRPSENKVPGNRLHEILLDRFNLDITEGCGCRKRINLMNAWGPKGCRENLDEIVAGMIAEARKQKWQIDGRPLLTALARVGTLTPLGIAFARAWARKLVLEAIEHCERSEPCQSESLSGPTG